MKSLMKSLTFSVECDERGAAAERRIRHARFQARSSLPVSAACVVANGVRETLSALLGAPVSVRLVEPAIPMPRAWQAILNRARCYRVRGNAADAAILLRTSDAAALAAALFGERREAGANRALSPIECDVLDRMVNAIAANLSAVCGAREGRSAELVTEIGNFVTYFELLVEGPAGARIGIALSREPSPEASGRIEVAQLASVKISVRGSFDLGKTEAASVAHLAAGSLLPIDRAAFQRGRLAIYGRRVGSGECGVRSGRYALSLDTLRRAI
jgi:flagellar motor switch protein FliM